MARKRFILNRNPARGRFGRPAARLAIALGLALVLLVLPECWTAPLKSGFRTVMVPGQKVAGAVRRRAERLTRLVQNQKDAAARLADTQEELQRLREENRRLTDELAAARSRSVGTGQGDIGDALLRPHCVDAHVLGQQALQFLERHDLLDIGANSGIEPGAIVIDRGAEGRLQPGRLALAGSRIWGRVVEVGSQTSAVRTVTSAGYRDLVRIASEGEEPASGVEGILEGTGVSLARIRSVEITAPVAVGDLVWSASGKGLLPRALLYGRVVRVEQAPEAAHWEIWMRPCVDPNQLEHVAVLQAELNPNRASLDKSRQNLR